MVAPILETGYERMFNTLKVSNTTNDSHVCTLCPPIVIGDPKVGIALMCVTYSYFCKTSLVLQ